MTVTEPILNIASAVPTALDQTSIPIEDLLHSANAGMIIHRTGQLEYAFSADHSWFAEEESVVLTVRWPSVPGYAVTQQERAQPRS